MKIFKFLIIIITCLFLSSNLFAYMRTIETVSGFRDMDITTICIDNYKFVIVQENVVKGSVAVDIEQIYEVSKDGKNSVPAKC